MNKIKQPVQIPEIAVTRSAFWGTIILGMLALLVFGYFLAFFLGQEKTLLINIATIVFLFSTLAALTSIVLTFRGRQQLATEIEFYTLFVMGIATISIFQGRQSAVISILLISILTILYLLPKQSRRWYWFVAITGTAVMWAIERMNPSWRLELNAARPGPAAVILFTLILGWIVFSQSRRFVEASLRNRLTAAFLALTFFTISAVGVVTNLVATAQLDEVLGKSFSDLSSRMALETGNTIARNKVAMDSLALNKFVQDSVAEANINGTSDVTLLTVVDQRWRSASDNNSLIRGVLDNELADELLELQARLPQYAEIFITDRYGAIIASTDRTSDYYQADEEWWQNAWNKGAGKVYISEPVFDESAGVYAINIALPIPAHESSEIIGVLRATVDINEMTNVLSADQLGKTGQAILLLPNNQFVSSEIGAELGALDAETLSNIESIQTGYAEITYDGIASEVGKAHVTASSEQDKDLIDQLNWTIVVHQDASESHAPVATTTRSIIYTAIAVLLGAGLLALYVSGQFVKPIENLTAIAGQIAHGDLSVKAAVTSQDEIGVLAKTFNSMTSQLHTTLSTLEQRVADRTRNLALAAEVGRSVSQVRTLDVMLKDACELILKEFNLYYVQVYLTDASGSNLRLEAGTGSVGDQLVGRGHSLPVNANSVNGRAATEKQSVVISDTFKSAAFRQNPLLPETKGEMAVPLIVADKVVGVLDMQSSQPGVLTVEVLPAFEALAGQLAVAIQNANLLAETQQARAQVEAQARRLVRQGWSEHLDAIHNPEQLGFVFDHNVVAPLAEAGESQLPENGKAISVPIAVTGESLGSLVVELDDETRAEQTSELVNVVARQVAQQIENLRLLESSERYRNEAEQASRRLTREGWKSYAEKSAESLQYIYDLNQVRPLNGDHVETAAAIPLKVRDEVVGKVAIQGLDKNDADALNLANAVAERLGAHIEGLRQYDQTQSALAQSEKLFEASRRITQAADLQELTAVAVEAINIPVINRAILTTFNYGAEGDVESLDVIANWWNGTGNQVTEVGTHYPSNVVRMMQTFISPTPLFFEDGFTDERVDAMTMQLVKRLNLRAVAVLPLRAGANQIGVLMLEAEEPYSFKEEEKRLFVALGPQISTVLENRRQFERAQGQAKREATLNLINQKIQSATSVEAVLQIAARELGTALGAPMTVAQLSLKDKTS